MGSLSEANHHLVMRCKFGAVKWERISDEVCVLETERERERFGRGLSNNNCVIKRLCCDCSFLFTYISFYATFVHLHFVPHAVPPH